MASVANGTAQVYAGHYYDGATSTATASYCINCHTDFGSFTTSLAYGHSTVSKAVPLSGVNYSSGYCNNCHVFTSGTYTSLTTTLKFDNTGAVKATSGLWTLSSSVSVTGKNDSQSFSDTHAGTKMQPDCSACHTYSSGHTTSTAVWTFKHDPSNTGAPTHQKSSSQQGCNECHENYAAESVLGS